MTFGDKVRYARKKMGNISTTQLAKLLEIAQASVSKVENSSTRKFKRESIVRLSEVSGLPLEFFMKDNIKTPEEVAPTKELAEKIRDAGVQFIKLNDTVKKRGLTEQEAIDLINLFCDTYQKIKRRD